MVSFSWWMTAMMQASIPEQLGLPIQQSKQFRAMWLIDQEKLEETKEKQNILGMYAFGHTPLEWLFWCKRDNH